jgi:hypothetical protein
MAFAGNLVSVYPDHSACVLDVTLVLAGVDGYERDSGAGVQPASTAIYHGRMK